MKYENYKWLFPPRPDAKIPPSQIDKYDNGEFAACPKYDGSSVVIFLDGKGQVIIRNRHNEEKTRVDESINFGGLHHGNGWMVICGELFDKSKRDERGIIIKGYAIWDILCYGSEYLIGSTFRERLDLMESLWPSKRMQVSGSGLIQYDHLCFTDVSGVYKAPAYLNGFADLYKDLVTTQLYEGLVLKKLDAKLEFGFSENNNQSWSLKIRRQTKNFAF